MSLSVIQVALEDLKKETINACWNWVWLEGVHGYKYKGFSPEEIQNKFVDKAARLAKRYLVKVLTTWSQQIHRCPLWTPDRWRFVRVNVCQCRERGGGKWQIQSKRRRDSHWNVYLTFYDDSKGSCKETRRMRTLHGFRVSLQLKKAIELSCRHKTLLTTMRKQ